MEVRHAGAGDRRSVCLFTLGGGVCLCHHLLAINQGSRSAFRRIPAQSGAAHEARGRSAGTEEGTMPSVLSRPPHSAVDPVTESLHGIRVADPYRWLEEQDSSRTRAW